MATRPQVTVVAVSVGWGTIGLLVREVDLPAVAVAWSRVVIGAAGLGMWCLVAGRHPTAGTKRAGSINPILMSASGTLLAVHWVAMFAALQQAPIGSVLLVVYLAPVGVALAAPRVLGERVGPMLGLSLAVAVIGTVLVVGPGVDGAGLPLAGVASVTYAAMMLLDKSLLRSVAGPVAQPMASDGVHLALVKQITAAVVLTPFAVLAPWGSPRASWSWLVVLGLVHTAAGLTLFLWALGRMPATEAGILAYLEPAAAVLFGWVVLAERPGPTVLAGGVLIVGAGIMAIRAGTGRTEGPMEVAGVRG